MNEPINLELRPVLFQALQWTGENTEVISRWLGKPVEELRIVGSNAIVAEITLRIPKGERLIRRGDWLLRDGFDYRILSKEELEQEFRVVD